MNSMIGALVVIGIMASFAYYIRREDKARAFEWLLEFKNRRALKDHFAGEGIQIQYVIKDRRVIATFSRKGVKHTRSMSFAKAYSLYPSHNLRSILIRLRK